MISARQVFMSEILVVDDDPRFQRALKSLFETEGYIVAIATNTSRAQERFRARTPSAIILEIASPAIHWPELLRLFKQNSPTVPVIVLSALGDRQRRVELLELGADDYVTKPYSRQELLARIRAQMRAAARSPAIKVSCSRRAIAFGDLSINFESMEIVRSGKSIVLTARQFKLLKLLVENVDHSVSRADLLNDVWQCKSAMTRAVDTQIWNLRRKLEEDPAQPVHLKTVRRVGYKFVP